MTYIYLAGPITGTTFDDSSRWRHEVSKSLDGTTIKTLSPLRGKEYLKKEGILHSGTYDGTLTSAKGIMRRDFFDCTRSSVVIVNLLGSKKVSIGTVMELAWCYQKSIPTVVIMEPGNLHNHIMLNDSMTYQVNSLEKAIEVTKILLGHNS